MGKRKWIEICSIEIKGESGNRMKQIRRCEKESKEIGKRKEEKRDN